MCQHENAEPKVVIDGTHSMTGDCPDCGKEVYVGEFSYADEDVDYEFPSQVEVEEDFPQFNLGETRVMEIFNHEMRKAA